MGKVEKIVVLSVLLLIVVILAVSLDSGGDGEVRAGGGRDGEEARLGDPDRDGRLSAPLDIPGEESRPAFGAESSRGEPGGDSGAAFGSEAASEAPPSGGLLNAAVLSGDAPGSRRPDPGADRGARRAGSSEPLTPDDPGRRGPSVAPGDAGDLLSLAGLSETPSPDLMSYTCLDGDTFKKIAARFYGDGSKSELLRRYNEGVRELTAGHVLFVPVHDDGYGSVEEYEVLEGESLWIVAKKVYGKGHLWNEIWEANRDRLKSPDAVRAGVVLRIP